MKKAIIFDVDGTLWNAVSVITDSWNQTISRYPEVTTRLTYDVMESMMGKTMDEFAELFPELEIERAKEILECCCKEEIEYLKEHPGTLYEGMREVLAELSEKYSLYIVSNCQNGYIETLLQGCNLGHLFEDFECYGRTGKRKGRNIQILMERCDIEKAIYVGDTQMDSDAAMEASIPFIFAAYGMGEVDFCRFVANSPSEIPEKIRGTRYFAL